MLNNEYQQFAVNAIAHSAEMARHDFSAVVSELNRPSVLFRPALCMDGVQWCALYGDNLQDGCAGFGDTPERAMRDFDRAWYAEPAQRRPASEQS